MSNEPAFEEVRARDVVPYTWGIWCSIEGSAPFVNEIVAARWSEDGEHIWFMLESHNFEKATPAQAMRLVRLPPNNSRLKDYPLGPRPGGER